jgi:dolichol-phosphate mannosyltransferase
VVPTLEEEAGIEAFLDALLLVLDGPLGEVPSEVLILDDASRDRTAELARARLGPRGRVVVRGSLPGLSRAVIEGWRLARGRVLGVMDADLSHPPALLPALLDAIEDGADLAVATRYMPGGGTEGWPLRRQLVSRTASALARTLVRARDPLSGYLLVRREVIEGVELDPTGWKVGLDLLVRGRHARVTEVPYVFHDRTAGVSKFGRQAAHEFLRHCARLRWHLTTQGRLRR